MRFVYIKSELKYYGKLRLSPRLGLELCLWLMSPMRENFRLFHTKRNLASLRTPREAAQSWCRGEEETDPLGDGICIDKECGSCSDDDDGGFNGLDAASCSETESTDHRDIDPRLPHLQACEASPASRIAGQRRTRLYSTKFMERSASAIEDEFEARLAEARRDSTLSSRQKRRQTSQLKAKRRKRLDKLVASSLSGGHGKRLLSTTREERVDCVDVTELFEDKEEIRWTGQTGEKRRIIHERLEAAYRRMLETGYHNTAGKSMQECDIPVDAREFSYVLNDDSWAYTRACRRRSLYSSVAQLITDKEGRILVVKVRPPSGEWYANAVIGAAEQLRKLHVELGSEPTQSTCGRATKDFKSTNFGYSFGGGQTVRSPFVSPRI